MRLFSCLGLGTSSPKAEVHAITKKVHQGENVTLQCDVRHGQETSWCRQHPEQVPVVIFQDALNIRSSEPDPEYHDGFGPRFSSVLNRTTWTVNLKIENISEWDFALYFCTVRVKGDIRFGNSTHLVSAASSAPSFPVAASAMPPQPFSSVPRQMLSGDAPEEESEGESEREEERGEGEEAELVIDIPNE
ncbi:UNVERIFIED_CONTAM: hypothetical protein FKN15_007287 [Acipenser sinensis]